MGRYETAAKVLDGGLARFEEEPLSCEVGARLATERGEVALKLNDYERAAMSAKRAEKILGGECEPSAPRVSVVRAKLQASNLLGKVYIFQARYQQALLIFEGNLEVARMQRWPEEVARAEGNLGIVAMGRFDYPEAIERLERVLEFSKHSPIVSRSICLLNLAVIHHYRFEFGRALEYVLEGLRVARQNEEVAVYSTCLANLVLLYRDMGALARGERAMKALTDENGPVKYSAVAPPLLGHAAELAYGREEYEEVVRLLAPFALSGEPDELISTRLAAVLRLAMTYCDLGDMQRARELFARTQESQGREEARIEVRRETVRARLEAYEGRTEEALEGFERAASMGRRTGNFSDAMCAEALRLDLLMRGEERPKALALAGRLVDELGVTGQRVPEMMRERFFGMAVNRRILEHAASLGVSLPEAIAGHMGAHRATQEEEVEAHDTVAWRAWRKRYEAIVGETPRLLQLFRIMDKVAVSDTPVLLLGESGTGKELFAEAIHRQSERASKPLVKVNCAAFVESLLMSELFGHEKGAFTGALSQKIGRFEMASGGTIFLDEIADISPQTQVALLRVLQEKEIERVGASATTQVDVRVVCATNKDLERMVREGTFRLDLYYRLKGMVLELPALRERREDVPRLAEAMASRVGEYKFSRAVMKRMVGYSWPGNVRELQNFVRSVLLFVEGDRVELKHIAQFDDFFSDGEVTEDVEDIIKQWLAQRRDGSTLEEGSAPEPEAPRERPPNGAPFREEEARSSDPEQALVEQIVTQGRSLTDLKKRLEIECIRRALIQTQGNVTKAAGLLQMKRPRLSQIINATEELADLKTDLLEAG